MIQSVSKLLTAPTHELGKWTRFLVLQIRIWLHCLRLLKINRCGTQAAALSYHSIFGLVPLAIVSLMVFQMFPVFEEVSEKVKAFAYKQMNLTSIEYPVETRADGGTISSRQTVPTRITVAEKLDELTKGYISKADRGAITVIGLALVIWAAIALLTTIEKTFNTIFHVGAGRSFLHRLFNYWALLTLGPILLALGIYVSGHVVKNKLYQKFMPQVQQQHVDVQGDEMVANGMTDPNAAGGQDHPSAQSGTFKSALTWLTAKIVPFLISVIAIFFLYFFLPNTRVSPGAALWGAFVAAVIWSAAKFGFGQYVTKFIPQFQVYGVLGIIPLTVMWIYLSWLIVLFGLQLTYATQNVKRLDAAEFNKARRQEQCFLANDQTVIRVMEYVLNAFERKDQKPVSVEAIAYRMGMPTDFTEKILNRMVQSGLLCHTSEPSVGFVPSTDGAHITLDEISRAIREVSFAQPSTADATNMQAVFDQMNRHLSQYTLKQVLNKEEDFSVQGEPLSESPYETDEQV